MLYVLKCNIQTNVETFFYIYLYSTRTQLFLCDYQGYTRVAIPAVVLPVQGGEGGDVEGVQGVHLLGGGACHLGAGGGEEEGEGGGGGRSPVEPPHQHHGHGKGEGEDGESPGRVLPAPVLLHHPLALHLRNNPPPGSMIKGSLCALAKAN